MQSFTKQQYNQLIENGKPSNRGKNHFPVVKLVMPGLGCTWLLTEINPENPAIAFGLCDLGVGFPELSYVDLVNISTVKNRFGCFVERDLYFKVKFPLDIYYEAALYCQQITEVEAILQQFVR